MKIKGSFVLMFLMLFLISGCGTVQKMNVLKDPRGIIDKYEGEDFCFYSASLLLFANDKDIIIGEGGEFVREIDDNGSKIRRYRQAPNLESEKNKDRYSDMTKAIAYLQRDISAAMSENNVTQKTYNSFWEHYVDLKDKLSNMRQNNIVYILDANLASLYDAILYLENYADVSYYVYYKDGIDLNKERAFADFIENYAYKYPRCIGAKQIAFAEKSKHKEIKFIQEDKERIELNAPTDKEKDDRYELFLAAQKRIKHMKRNLEVLLNPDYKF